MGVAIQGETGQKCPLPSSLVGLWGWWTAAPQLPQMRS